MNWNKSMKRSNATNIKRCSKITGPGTGTPPAGTRDNIESLETLRLLMDTGLRVIRQFRIVETREKDLKNNLLRILSEESLVFPAGNRRKNEETAVLLYSGNGHGLLRSSPCPNAGTEAFCCIHYHDDQYLVHGEKYTDVFMPFIRIRRRNMKKIF